MAQFRPPPLISPALAHLGVASSRTLRPPVSCAANAAWPRSLIIALVALTIVPTLGITIPVRASTDNEPARDLK